MDYMTVREAAEKWGLKARMVHEGSSPFALYFVAS
jgi:hypothetical protein